MGGSSNHKTNNAARQPEDCSLLKMFVPCSGACCEPGETTHTGYRIGDPAVGYCMNGQMMVAKPLSPTDTCDDPFQGTLASPPTWAVCSLEQWIKQHAGKDGADGQDADNCVNLATPIEVFRQAQIVYAAPSYKEDATTITLDYAALGVPANATSVMLEVRTGTTSQEQGEADPGLGKQQYVTISRVTPTGHLYTEAASWFVYENRQSNNNHGSYTLPVSVNTFDLQMWVAVQQTGGDATAVAVPSPPGRSIASASVDIVGWCVPPN